MCVTWSDRTESGSDRGPDHPKLWRLQRQSGQTDGQRAATCESLCWCSCFTHQNKITPANKDCDWLTSCWQGNCCGRTGPADWLKNSYIQSLNLTNADVLPCSCFNSYRPGVNSTWCSELLNFSTPLYGQGNSSYDQVLFTHTHTHTHTHHSNTKPESVNAEERWCWLCFVTSGCAVFVILCCYITFAVFYIFHVTYVKFSLSG